MQEDNSASKKHKKHLHKKQKKSHKRLRMCTDASMQLGDQSNGNEHLIMHADDVSSLFSSLCYMQLVVHGVRLPVHRAVIVMWSR